MELYGKRGGQDSMYDVYSLTFSGLTTNTGHGFLGLG
jgi:hypothetical protein